MTKFLPFAAILRFEGVTVSQSALEATLGTKVERYEPSQHNPAHYAQIDIPTEPNADWRTLVDFLEAIGPSIAILKQKGEIGSAKIDLAVSLSEQMAYLSVTLPSYFTKAAGYYEIDTEISVYPTSTT